MGLPRLCIRENEKPKFERPSRDLGESKVRNNAGYQGDFLETERTDKTCVRLSIVVSQTDILWRPQWIYMHSVRPDPFLCIGFPYQPPEIDD